MLKDGWSSLQLLRKLSMVGAKPLWKRRPVIARDCAVAQSMPTNLLLREHREISPVPASRIKCPGKDLHTLASGTVTLLQVVVTSQHRALASARVTQ